MPDGIGAFIFRLDEDERPGTAKIFRVPMVLKPADGEDVDYFIRVSGACDVLERTVGQSLEC